MEILELKITVFKKKKSLDRLNSRMEMIEQRISQPES